MSNNKEAFLTPLNRNNPVTVQILGICSSLAVTAQHTRKHRATTHGEERQCDFAVPLCQSDVIHQCGYHRCDVCHAASYFLLGSSRP